jgi:hypothetical protein
VILRAQERYPLKYILEAGLAMDDPTIRDAAEEIAHLLGSKGCLQYRALLRTQT